MKAINFFAWSSYFHAEIICWSLRHKLWDQVVYAQKPSNHHKVSFLMKKINCKIGKEIKFVNKKFAI